MPELLSADDLPMTAQILIAGPRPMLNDAFAALLRSEKGPVVSLVGAAELARVARDGVSAKRVVVVVDPDRRRWDDELSRARAVDARLGALVVLARSSYWQQRRWRQRQADGRLLVDGLLPIEAKTSALRDAISEIAASPGAPSRFWLADQSLHPGHMAHSGSGVQVREVLQDSRLHRALVLEGRLGRSRAQVAAEFGYEVDTVSKWLRAIRKDLGLGSDVGLGAWATEMGLLDDVASAGTASALSEQ
jgi:DNA-binding NarL/FixJ family response regulator